LIRTTTFLTALALLIAGPALACDIPPEPKVWSDAKIDIAADGSFVEAGRIWSGSIDGGPVTDLGKGRVAQKITLSFACDTHESLLFVDCRTGQTITLLGQYVAEESFGGGSTTRIDRLQAPKGAIRWSKVDTLDNLAKVAARNGYEIGRDATEEVAAMRRRDRYDPYNGCKMFYSDSAGAGL
jgi:hypothetical protein